MNIYRNEIKIASHTEAPSHRVNHKLSQVSPGTFQNKYGVFDDQKAQAEMFVQNIKNITGIDVDVSKVDVDGMGSCDVVVDEGRFVAIESLRRAD